MAKRRTRKEKEKARHTFLVSWKGAQTGSTLSDPVKRQFETKPQITPERVNRPKKTDILDKYAPSASLKKNILKSLISASFIIALELVIYLAWNKLPR